MPTGDRTLTTWLRRTLGPLLLLICCPSFVILFWYTNVSLEGSLWKLVELFQSQGFFTTVYGVWSPVFFGTAPAWKIIAGFAAFQLILMRIAPGKICFGPMTRNGHIPIYKANGVSAYFITIILFYLLAFRWEIFSPTVIYDNFGGILGALNLFSWFFCLVLYFKGRISPSSTDCGTSRNFIFDFYWGTELYPRIFGWDVKMFTNCRFGMMGWALIILSYAAKQNQLHGLSDSMFVAVSLQLLYVTKFFFWEKGYLRSLDIMHDRAGYYICWGCLVWLPCIYTSPALYLVTHPNHLGVLTSSIILTIGAAAILINYLSDRQRQLVRHLNGDCKVWGKAPELTVASYTTKNGERKESLLLASGWWGLSRHFHYIPELIGAFCWSVPALFANFSPYFYIVFLTILLFDRATRDDKRCAQKYGEDWDTHCKRVPYKIIPYVY